MAWKRNIASTCPCGKVAAWEVLNSRNASFGRFCSKCADSKVKMLEREEAKEARDRGDGT